MKFYKKCKYLYTAAVENECKLSANLSTEMPLIKIPSEFEAKGDRH